jgi:hypothetical protein
MRRAGAFAVLLALVGCAAHRTPSWQGAAAPFGTVSDEIVADLVRDGDRAWAARADSAQLAEATRAYSAALRYHPDDHGIMLKLGRVAFRRGGHGDGAAAFDLAAGWAERALATRNPALAAAARAHGRPEDVFGHAEAPDAPALALYAEALLHWAIRSSMSTLLVTRPWIEAAARRALALDRGVAWAGPDRVLGLLDCALPASGQNLRDALERFEAAVAAAPSYLPNRLDYAERYALRTRDAALWRRLLAEVTAADAAALPDAEPENREAQATARTLLARGN